MGITKNCAKFLTYAKYNGASFQRTIMLGRQSLFVSADEINEQLKYFKIDNNVGENTTSQFAEPLFHALGAEVVDSLDFSDFENATVIADLNEPILGHLKNRYDVVFDGGTLEHVFNFPVAIKNSMDMLKVGGHFIAITPTNNQCGHGFYQFSPELFFSLFSQEHGFKTNLIALGVELPGVGIRDWYAIKEPKKVKRRVTLTNSFPTYLMVIAEKIESVDGRALRPMQSDYQNIWDVHKSIKDDLPIQNENRLIHVYRKYFPKSIKRMVRLLRGKSVEKLSEVEGLGTINPNFFEKINV